MKIWVVAAGSGEYSGRREFPVVAYDNSEAANAHADKGNADDTACYRALENLRRTEPYSPDRHQKELELEIKLMPMGVGIDDYVVHEIDLRSAFEYPGEAEPEPKDCSKEK